MKLLEGKKAIITGGTSGIGKAIAIAFAKQGAQVVVIGTNEERAKEVVKQLKTLAASKESKMDYLIMDVANMGEVQKGIEQLMGEWPSIDILVNCAGITRDKLLLRMELSDWNDVLQVNLQSVFNFTKAILRPMMKARKGRIINIASVIGLTGNPGQVNYAASKAGMIGFSRSLAKEVATRGITVNTIAPGFIETPMTDKLTAEQKESILKGVPMARLGSSEEVANAALFLASDLSSYITGEVIAVDGGMLA